ncbi:MAG: deoxyribose-phosphate aldolase [Acidimicrobiales bacterium]|nr:deoxyribose-phosphate aldolase [Acidimicrobiales bacterium]
MERADLARMIDHTLLAPETTPGQIAMFCGEASELGVGAVCVSPGRLPLPAGAVPADIGVATVIGFPSGAHRSETKAAEARRAVLDGATELDMVIDLGAAASGLWAAVEADIASVRSVAPEVVLKVIIESAMLGTAERIRAACRAAESAGADFVKTSTGFHPSGGATVEAVSVMAAEVGGRLGVKASGGIRDTGAALRMIDAGATRLGCSASRSILEGL